MTDVSGNKAPTLRTIAELTGLSVSTVSLSLRDGAKLKQETRDKIAKAAREVGYVPNRAGVRLRTGQTNVLTFVLPHDRHGIDFTRSVIQGIGAQLEKTRFHLNVMPEPKSDDPTSAVRYILDNRTSDGVILTRTSARDPRVQILADAGLPFVTHGRTEFYTPHAFHDFHIERFVELAVERLISLGRKKFLLVVCEKDTTYFALLGAAYFRSIVKQGVSGEFESDANTLNDPQLVRAFGRSLGQQLEFDALICENELTALSLVSGLAESGRTLGRDYDLICKQTTEILPALYPKMDTVAEDLLATGESLAKLLIDQLNGAPVENLGTLQEPVPSWEQPT